MIRTYPLQHSINKGKQEKILTIVCEYRRLAVQIAELQWRDFFQHGALSKDAKITGIETGLSKRYQQTCQYQVVGVLKSFLTNRQNEFVEMVWHSSLSEETRHQLFYINKYQLWFAKSVQMPKGDEGKKLEEEKTKRKKAIELAQADVNRLQGWLKSWAQEDTSANDPEVVAMIIKTQDALERAHLRLADALQKAEEEKKGQDAFVAVPPEVLKLARAIFKHILKKHRRPSLRHCNLALDNKVAKVEERQKAHGKQAKKFDYWITLSTLDKGKTIALPLLTNEYFQDKKGERKKFCQINTDKDDQVTVCLIKDVPKAEKYLKKTPTLALDFGLRNLFTTNFGDLYGRNFLSTLQKYDRAITPLAQNRQRQGLSVASKKYTRLVQKLQSFLKNEIHRVIANMIAQYHPHEIAIEKLHFSSPQLSNSINRIISNCGRKIIRQKFKAVEEEFGIIITENNPAYTSQTCDHCGYIAHNNRKSQSQFRCEYCHKKINADVNAARNIFTRSSCKVLSNVYASKTQILKTLIAFFFILHPFAYQYAATILRDNPYFQNAQPPSTALCHTQISTDSIQDPQLLFNEFQ